MFNKKSTQSKTDKYEQYIKYSLQENYYFPCFKICFADYSTPISGTEKLCLAKCLDRAYDYMRNIQEQNDPFVPENVPRLEKLDGKNLLNLKRSKLTS